MNCQRYVQIFQTSCTANRVRSHFAVHHGLVEKIRLCVHWQGLLNAQRSERTVPGVRLDI